MIPPLSIIWLDSCHQISIRKKTATRINKTIVSKFNISLLYKKKKATIKIDAARIAFTKNIVF
ncbi:hypothetical protein C240_2525 [Enterococcus sp. 5H]|nr:hypothetical protein [Enterococcus sp. 5H]